MPCTFHISQDKSAEPREIQVDLSHPSERTSSCTEFATARTATFISTAFSAASWHWSDGLFGHQGCWNLHWYRSKKNMSQHLFEHVMCIICDIYVQIIIWLFLSQLLVPLSIVVPPQFFRTSPTVGCYLLPFSLKTGVPEASLWSRKGHNTRAKAFIPVDTPIYGNSNVKRDEKTFDVRGNLSSWDIRTMVKQCFNMFFLVVPLDFGSNMKCASIQFCRYPGLTPINAGWFWIRPGSERTASRGVHWNGCWNSCSPTGSIGCHLAINHGDWKIVYK